MSEGRRPENVLNTLKETFHFDHFYHYYRSYVPAAIIIGIVCGLFMVLFQILIDTTITALSIIPVFIAPIIGGLFSGLMIYIGYEEVKGSGISMAIEMTHTPGAMRDSVALTKTVATAISIGSGNPVGREGPAVLIGATIGNSIGRRLGFRDPSFLRVFLMMGSAAATAGIYKAPLGGALFATEAPYRRDARLGYFVPTVIAALTSYIVFVAFYFFAFGHDIEPLLGFDASFELTIGDIPLLVFFSVICGVISITFAGILMGSRNYFTIKLPDWADPIAGSILACVIIFAVGFIVMDPALSIAGLGYNVITLVATSSVPILVLLALLAGKLLASSFVVGARVSGGVLASSLFVGAMLGKIFGDLIAPGMSTAYMVLGMGAVLAATTNTPVATTVLMLEISRSFDLVIPLALCVCISYLVSGGTSLYEGQKVCREDEDPDYYAPINILPNIELELRTDESNPIDVDPSSEE
ncbi:MAG: chloride channel protein [Candidatus Thorarchaeota archaeon]|nr:MAG: chloride channel protein [Candidatus Thorarchaeota archaeon]